MALANITQKLNIGIDLTQLVPRFTFQDSTDYDIAGVSLSGVEGNLKLTVNGAATPTYDNLNDWTTPDIKGLGQANLNLTRFITKGNYISVPLDASNNIIEGTYAFTYQVSNNDGATTVVTTVTYDIQYDKVSGAITSSVDLNPRSPSLTIVDATNYMVEAITPTNNRTLTLFYPPNSSLGGSTSTTAASLTVNQFNKGNQSATLANTVTYDYSTKVSVLAATTATAQVLTLNIIDSITANKKSIPVESITSICSVYCCVKAFTVQLQQATSTQRNMLRQKAGEVALYLEMISDAYACSKEEDINTYVKELKDLIGCDDNCGCTDNITPVVIEAIGLSGMPVNNAFVYAVSGVSTYTEPLLIGLTYETAGQPRRNDFLVFVGSAGTLMNLTAFDTSTGKMTFSGNITATLTVIRLR
jgi:phage gp36-like protein